MVFCSLEANHWIHPTLQERELHKGKNTRKQGSLGPLQIESATNSWELCSPSLKPSFLLKSFKPRFLWNHWVHLGLNALHASLPEKKTRGMGWVLIRITPSGLMILIVLNCGGIPITPFGLSEHQSLRWLTLKLHNEYIKNRTLRL